MFYNENKDNLTREEISEMKNIVSDFFNKAGFSINVEQMKKENDTVFVKLKTEEPKILIGQNGQTLIEIQHLLKSILKHKTASGFFIDIDINDYKEKKKEYLKETAISLADEAVLARMEKVLPPMPAYERRVIHLALSKREDVLTESLGEGDERRVVIKPKN